MDTSEMPKTFKKMTPAEKEESLNKTRLTHITWVCSSRDELVLRGKIHENTYRDDLYKDPRCRPNGRTLTLVAGFNNGFYQWNIHDGEWVEDSTTFCPDASQFAEIRKAFDAGNFELADRIARHHYEQADRIAALNIGLTKYLL